MKDQSTSQADAIAFLEDPKSYDPQPESVKRIDTHAAIVFLSGKHAYKIKRAVRYPYLDFSTLEKRRQACLHELERNKPTAPEIYLDVGSINRTSEGRLALDEPGEPIEWLVRMNRFDQSLLFDKMAMRKTLETKHMVQLADKIATYHAKARRIHHFDFESNLSEIITSTVASFSKAPRLIDLDDVRQYAKDIVRHSNQTSNILRARGRDGYTRLCHGDLHLQNIVLFEGHPTLFDAIEFNDEFATIDTLFDLAFVLMDLWFRDLKTHANVLFNCYMSNPKVEEDLKGLALLPLFLGLRAAIRAMVTLDRVKLISDEKQRDAEENIAKKYFHIASSFLQTNKPIAIAIGGRSGTGKTTLAAAIAPQVGNAPGALHLRSDVERKRMFGINLENKLEQEAYTPNVSQAIYQRICDKAERALRAGHSVIFDAAFLSPQHRSQVAKTARKAGVNFIGIWLEANKNTLVERVGSRIGDASDANEQVVRKQFETDIGLMDWHVFNAQGEREKVLHSVTEYLSHGTRVLKQVF